MRGQWPRVVAGVAVFAIAVAVGILLVGRFDTAPDPQTFINQVTADSWALILAVAMVLGAATFFGLEYLQTGRLASVEGQFTTRTIVLMPVAIAINIALGTALAYALKIPIYLDSIGTILVGALCGPIAGAVTGALGNILWSYVIPPPFQYPPAAAFAIVAAVIGLIAGLAGRMGLLRPRPDRSVRDLAIGGGIAIGLILVMAWLALLGYQAILGGTSLQPSGENVLLVALGWIALGIAAATIVGLGFLLAVRRDLTAAYTVVLGVGTGIVAALISAPISAGVFGGVTASGTDFLVAAFRQAGADLQAATLGQGLVSDPIDKVITFVVVYILIGAMARRTRARFPQGERLVEHGGTEAAA
jgi:hypothetical protein